MTDIDPTNSEPGPDASVDDIRADIEATRHELGQTVEALTAKLDVKEQAKQKVSDTRAIIVAKAQLVQSKGADLDPRVLVAAAVAAVLVGVAIWKRRH